MASSNEAEEALQFQREVSKILLEQLNQHGFVLTGSGALREHGLIDRPTQDVDMFTEMSSAEQFKPATDEAVQSLREAGYDVEVRRDFDTFKDINITRGDQQLEVDFGVDYRGHQPAHMDIGPVLSMEDAVGSKVSALYGRGYPRDFLDVDSIRQSGRFTDEQLVAAAQTQDPGLEQHQLGKIIQGIDRMHAEEVASYGVSEEEFEALKQRMSSWGKELTGQTPAATEASAERGLESDRELHVEGMDRKQKIQRLIDRTEKGPRAGAERSAATEQKPQLRQKLDQAKADQQRRSLDRGPTYKPGPNGPAQAPYRGLGRNG